MNNNRSFFASLLASAAIFMISGQEISAGSPEQEKADSLKGLKDYYNGYFTIGAAVSPGSIKGEESKLLLKHFGSITPENTMKPAPIHPEENKYSWEATDAIANFAKSNGLKMRGHTLLWHRQSPGWFFRDEKGNAASRELALSRLKDHISQVVGRYKGTVYAWDVVNEAIDDDPSKTYRETDWYRTCGPDYIAEAFRYAHAADPDALLFYNDYNTENPVKRAKIIKLLKELKEKGVPVHGVGLQGHWSIGHPTEAELRKSLDEYAALGLKIQITELDISVYPSSHNDPAEDVFTVEREEKQKEQYKMIFRVFRDYRSLIQAVTFWNVSDRYSWLDNFPVRGRKNYPLLFDSNYKPKKAYWEVVKW